MDNQERQAALLAAYQTALERDPAAPAPAGLDPAVAAIARQLAQLPTSPEPDPAFVAALARRLDLRPSAGRTPPSAAPGLGVHAPISGALPLLPPPGAERQGRRGPWTRLWFGANALGSIALVAALAVAVAVVLPVMLSGGGWSGRGTSPTVTTSAGRPTSCTGTLAPQQPATPPARPIPATPTGHETERYIPCAFERDPGLQRVERAGLVQHLNATQAVNDGTVTVERAYADGSQIVIAYLITGPAWANDDFRMFPHELPTLTDSAGRTYQYASNIHEGYSGSINNRRVFASLLFFDASILPAGTTQETFQLAFPDLQIEKLVSSQNSPTPAGTAGPNVQRTPPGQQVAAAPNSLEVAGTIGPWSLAITLPVAPTRIAEVNQTMTAPVTASYSQGEAGTAVPRCNACPAAPAAGIAITVERVVTTPSETQVYLRFQAPDIARQAGWEVRSSAVQDPDSPPTQQGGTRYLPDGSVAITFSNPLYDKQGEWTLTIGELWALVPPDQPGDTRGYVQVRLNGQWVYRFTMP
jgi:hypothetical protein